MTINGSFGEPLPPRVVEALLPLSNYIRPGETVQLDGYTRLDATLETDIAQLRFEISDARDSHGTSAKIFGLGPNAIDVYGLPILYAEKKLLLEVWNDSELNCWCERDLETGKEVFVRESELESYLSRYVKDSAVKDQYVRDVRRFYGTAALNYCQYYFESDKVEDRRILLDRCATIEGVEEKWSVVKRIAEEHLSRNERHSTWRGLCVLWLANELFFRGSEIEPKFLAEYDLLSNTALNWGGLSQVEWIRRAARHIPFVIRLFEMTTEPERGGEVWKVAFYQILIGLIGREGTQQGSDKLDDLRWLMKKAAGGEEADRRVAKLFLEGLASTGLLNGRESAVLRARK